MTTLADHIIALTVQNIRPEKREAAVIIREAMIGCTKYVVRPEVLDIVLEVMESTPRAEIPWPLPILENVWMENVIRNPGGVSRTGLLLREGGVGVVVFLAQERSFGIHALTHDLAEQEVTIRTEDISDDDRREVGWAVDMMLLTLHMIQQPRIVERRLVVHDERLQRSRARSGKRPLVDFQEVTVHVTRRERDAAAAAADLERCTGRRLHHVRAFYRVRLGRIERVSAHWRGSAELGVSITTGHRVAR